MAAQPVELSAYDLSYITTNDIRESEIVILLEKVLNERNLKILAGSGSVYWAESCKIVFLRGHFQFTCSDTLAVLIHSITDRRTDDITMP